jgi:hypothetical protein
VDKVRPLLKDPPKKKGFVVAAAPPAPLNMDVGTPWQQPPLGGALPGTKNGPGFDATKSMSSKDFQHFIKSTHSLVAKPGTSDAWTAGLHDSIPQ